MKSNLHILEKPPFRSIPNELAPVAATRIAPVRLQLAPIPWGRPDRATGFAVCQHIVEATPPTVIPVNPITHARLRRLLRTSGIHC